MKIEYCCKCDAPTGKAGAGDDSLYTDHDGPFCEDCFPDKEKPQRTWVELTGFEQKELMAMSARDAVFATEAKLRSKNT